MGQDCERRGKNNCAPDVAFGDFALCRIYLGLRGVMMRIFRHLPDPVARKILRAVLSDADRNALMPTCGARGSGKCNLDIERLGSEAITLVWYF